MCELFDGDDVRHHTTRRPLSRLTWPIESAPTERERLRALARLAADDPREASARIRERLAAQARSSACGVLAADLIRHPRALALLASRETFRVTDLERMAGCSSAWFIERYLRPGGIDQGSTHDARLDRARRAAALLQASSRRIPGAERVTPERRGGSGADAPCVDGALDSGLRIDADDLQRRELPQGLQRDLEQLVRAEATARSTLVPRELEVAFKNYELAPGVAVGGKIDRVESTRMSARGIVVDYKSGAAPSAAQIHDEARLQIPLDLLVLRDRLGLEPMGGVYMPVGGGRRARGLLRGR